MVYATVCPTEAVRAFSVPASSPLIVHFTRRAVISPFPGSGSGTGVVSTHARSCAVNVSVFAVVPPSPEVFETVRTIVSDHLEEIAKITYDLQADHKVKVEVTQNM